MTIDEIEDLRAELRSCDLTDHERKEAEQQLAALLKQREAAALEDEA